MTGRWSRLTRQRRRLLVEATAELFVARLKLLPLPGSDWQKALGCRSPLVPSDGPRTEPGSVPRTGPPDDVSSDVGWAIRAAAARVPWRSVCLPQAIAAQHMLRRRSISARAVVGARRSESESESDKPIDLHVWVIVGGRVVVGGGGHTTFAPVVAYDG
jgi:hypothetical protein